MISRIGVIKSFLPHYALLPHLRFLPHCCSCHTCHHYYYTTVVALRRLDKFVYAAEDAPSMPCPALQSELGRPSDFLIERFVDDRWDGLDFGAQFLLDAVEIISIVVGDKINCQAEVPKASRTTNSMEVSL